MSPRCTATPTRISKQTALDEKGNVVNGRGDKPNRHDMLTGSMPDGTATADQTCGNWTADGAEGAAMVGHHDRTGLDDSAPPNRGIPRIRSRRLQPGRAAETGGDGLFYCFAAE